MPRILRSVIADHAGGVNIGFSEELDTPEVLRFASNVRTIQYGSVRKRSQTKRIHETALGDGINTEIKALFQWRGPAGRQVVAVCGGDFWYKGDGDTDFTRVALGIDLNVRPRFAVHRVGIDPRLYMADGTTLYSFDGSVVQVVATPFQPKYIRVYNTRMFGISDDQWLRFSGVNAPEGWSIEFDGAGQAAISTYDTENLNALHVVGASLLCFKENSITRFTGYDIRDIQIDTGAVGVSAEVGTISPETVVRVEDVLFFLSDRGPYLATESGVKFIGINIEPLFEALTLTQLSNAIAVHNRVRREVWLGIPTALGDGIAVWRYNYRMQAWWGPDEFPYTPSAFSRFERADGSESVLIGGTDGFIRDGEVQGGDALDDVLLDGTGGVAIQMRMDYRELDFGDESYMKLMYPSQTITADLGLDGLLTVEMESEIQPTRTIALPAKREGGVGVGRGIGTGEAIYRYRPSVRGRKIYLTLREDTKSQVQISQLQFAARLGRARFT